MKSAALQSVKFLKLKRRLSLSHWQCVGLLEAVWLFTQANAPLGDIGRHTDEDIAAAIEWEGDATELVAALVACGWVDACDENRLVVHDWKDHAPTYLKGGLAKNGVTFKTPAKHPAKHGAKHPAKQDAKEPAKDPASHGALLTKPNLTKPNPTQPNQTQPEESGDPAQPGLPPPPPAPPTTRPDDTVLTFPTNGHGPAEWHLTARQVAEWGGMYPGVDVLAECRKALAWATANRTKRKTARGMPAFLVNWLNRTNDNGRPANHPQRSPPPPPAGSGNPTLDLIARRKAEAEAQAKAAADAAQGDRP